VASGADGIHPEGYAKVEDVIYTIREVAAGRTVLPNTIDRVTLFSGSGTRSLEGEQKPQGAIRMTEREKEIIALITDGMSNKQIAVRLNIATFTVKSHVHNMLEKLELHSRLSVVLFTRRGTSNPDDRLPKR